MKFMTIVLTLLVLASGCSRSSRTPASAPDGEGQFDGELAESEVASDEDSHSTVDIDLDIQIEPDMAEVSGSGSDTLGQSDIEPGTPPTSVTWELPPPTGVACLAEAATATSDPRPGQPCSQEGELRCTLAGAYEKKIPDQTYCVKPYRVRCVATGSGYLWQPETCNLPPTECYHPDYNPPSCQENDNGSVCCPLVYVGQVTIDEKPAVVTNGRLCTVKAGTISCGGKFSSGRVACQYFADPVFQAQLEVAKQQNGKQCAAWCKDCKYWYPTELCKPVYQNTCSGGGVMGKSFQVCVSLPGEKDRCAESCQDLDTAGYPWQPWAQP